MTLISPHCPPMSSCICLAKMGSGASGLALYWNRLVWENTCAPFRATRKRDTLVVYYTPTVVPPAAARKRTGSPQTHRSCPSLYSAKCVEGEFSEVRRHGVLRSPLPKEVATW